MFLNNTLCKGISRFDKLKTNTKRPLHDVKASIKWGGQTKTNWMLKIYFFSALILLFDYELNQYFTAAPNKKKSIPQYIVETSSSTNVNAASFNVFLYSYINLLYNLFFNLLSNSNHDNKICILEHTCVLWM